MEISAKAIDLIAEEIKKCPASYDDIADATLLSKSTISRVVKQRKASPYTIKQLVAYLEIGDKYREIVGDEEEPQGCQLSSDLMEELASVRAEWSQRLREAAATSEARITFLQEQLAGQIEARQRERELQERAYERSTGHLKDQIARLERNNDMLVGRLIDAEKNNKDSLQRAIYAEAENKESAKMRYRVFIICSAVIVSLIVALIVALSTDRVI